MIKGPGNGTYERYGTVAVAILAIQKANSKLMPQYFGEFRPLKTKVQQLNNMPAPKLYNAKSA